MPAVSTSTQVKAGGLQESNGVLQDGGSGQVLTPGCHTAHVNVLTAQRVHADAVAQQCTSGAPAGGGPPQARQSSLRG